MQGFKLSVSVLNFMKLRYNYGITKNLVLPILFSRELIQNSRISELSTVLAWNKEFILIRNELCIFFIELRRQAENCISAHSLLMPSKFSDQYFCWWNQYKSTENKKQISKFLFTWYWNVGYISLKNNNNNKTLSS